MPELSRQGVAIGSEDEGLRLRLGGRDWGWSNRTATRGVLGFNVANGPEGNTDLRVFLQGLRHLSEELARLADGSVGGESEVSR